MLGASVECVHSLLTPDAVLCVQACGHSVVLCLCDKTSLRIKRKADVDGKANFGGILCVREIGRIFLWNKCHLLLSGAFRW